MVDFNGIKTFLVDLKMHQTRWQLELCPRPRSTHWWRGWGDRWIYFQSQFLGYATVVNLHGTKSYLFDLKCTKIAVGWSSAPIPHWGSLQRSSRLTALPRPLAVRGGERGGGEGRGVYDFAPSTSTSWLRHWIEVNFRFERYWWFCLINFWNFHTIHVVEVRESIADISI